MKIIEEYIEKIILEEDLSIALGNFDGVHRGHRTLIEKAVEISKEMNIKSAVFTFDVHPIRVLKPDSNVKIITNNEVKAKLIENLGVDYLFFVKFNPELAHMEEKQFIKLLKQNLRCKSIVCGYNYTYGNAGHGNVSTLLSHKKELDFKLTVLDKITYQEQDVSSSHIRHLIENGNLHGANELLGYNYFILGKVIKGKQLGRKLGFPTANLQVNDNICLKNGVYISQVCIDGNKYPAISSIGKNPTVGDTKRMFETHIFDFAEDLYDREICVELLEFIRGEVKFPSIEELKTRVFMDIDVAKQYFFNK